MSRTFRHIPHWAGEHFYQLMQDMVNGSVDLHMRARTNANTPRLVRGQEGAHVGYIGTASARSPNGHSYREQCGRLGKKFAKRRTAHIMRRRGSKEVRERLVEHQYYDHVEMMDMIAEDAHYNSNEYGDGLDDDWHDYADTSMDPPRDDYDADRYDYDYGHDYDFDFPLRSMGSLQDNISANKRNTLKHQLKELINEHGLSEVYRVTAAAFDEIALDDLDHFIAGGSARLG